MWKVVLLFWAGAISTNCKDLHDGEGRRKPVIIDTDIGSFHDDFPAIALALLSRELDVRLLVTCSDDTRARAAVAGKLLTLAGKSHIPIGIGVPTDHATERPLFSWANDFVPSSYVGGVYEDGIAKMAEVILSSKDTVEVLALGPLTNFPRLLLEYPDVVRKARVTAMAGAIRIGYFYSPTVSAEYNVVLCPACADRVMRAGWRVQLAPLDTCIDAFFSPLTSAKLFVGCRSANNVSAALVQTFGYFFPFWQFMIHDNWHVNPVLYDAVATLMLLSDSGEYLADYEELRIVTDDAGYTRVNETAGALVDVAVRWKDPGASEMFMEHIADMLCSTHH